MHPGGAHGPMSQQTGGYGNSVKLTTGNLQTVPVINQPSGFRLAQTFTLLLGISKPPLNTATVLNGTVSVTNGSTAVAFAQSQAGILAKNQYLTFAIQPGTLYQIASFNGTTGVTLTGPFDGTTSTTTATFQLGPQVAGAPVTCNCVASMNWVENGHQVQRTVTVGPGAGVSISGSGTGVQVELSDVPLGDGYTTGITYEVTALLAPGVRASSSQLPVYQTQIVQTVAPTASLTVSIPANAGIRGVILSAVNTAAGGGSNVYAQALTPGGDALKIWDPQIETGVVALPPAATTLTVTNLDTDAAQVSILWVIDG
jgi:hypothetical protein